MLEGLQELNNTKLVCVGITNTVGLVCLIVGKQYPDTGTQYCAYIQDGIAANLSTCLCKLLDNFLTFYLFLNAFTRFFRICFICELVVLTMQ